MKKAAFILCLALLIQAGCGDDGKSNITLRVVQNSPAATPSGDGAANDYPDEYLTPTDVKVGLARVRLLKTGSTNAGFTLLDATFDRPRVVTIASDVQEMEDMTGSDPDSGTYDKIEYAVSYYEVAVPVCDGTSPPVCDSRRVRLYLADASDPDLGGKKAKARDILMAATTGRSDFGWIDLHQGLPTLLFTRPLYPSRIAKDKVPAVQPHLATLTLSPAVIIPSDKSDTDTKFTLTLAFSTGNLFFYDNTDATASGLLCDRDPCFNALADVAASRDGKFQRPCPTPDPTPTPTPDPAATPTPTPTPCSLSADFWPGLPTVGVAVEIEPNVPPKPTPTVTPKPT